MTKRKTPSTSLEITEKANNIIGASRRDLLKYGAAAAGVVAAGGASRLAMGAPLGADRDTRSGFSAEALRRASTSLSPIDMTSSPPTFGTSYISIGPSDMYPFGNGEWNYSGSPDRYPVTGSTFYGAVGLNLPNGSTLTECEGTIQQNVAGNTTFYLYKFAVDGSAFFEIGQVNSSTVQTGLQTLVMSFPPETVDSQNYQYCLMMTFGTLNDTSNRFFGARVGYTGVLGTLFPLPTPDRYVDTRPGAQNRGGLSAPFTNIGNTFDFTVTGVAGRDGRIIPAGATAVVGNVTAVAPSANGLFKILPGGSATTLGTSTVNFNAGFTTANSFLSQLNNIGQLRAFYSGGGQSDLLIDIVGYYKP